MHRKAARNENLKNISFFKREVELFRYLSKIIFYKL